MADSFEAGFSGWSGYAGFVQTFPGCRNGRERWNARDGGHRWDRCYSSSLPTSATHSLPTSYDLTPNAEVNYTCQLLLQPEWFRLWCQTGRYLPRPGSELPADLRRPVPGRARQSRGLSGARVGNAKRLTGIHRWTGIDDSANRIELTWQSSNAGCLQPVRQ